MHSVFTPGCKACESHVAAPSSNLQVQRYRCVTRHGDMGDTSAEMKLDPDGAYVLYVDYERAKFAPLGDNHHNANACPYCRGAVETAAEPGELERLRKLEEHIERMACWCDPKEVFREVRATRDDIQRSRDARRAALKTAVAPEPR